MNTRNTAPALDAAAVESIAGGDPIRLLGTLTTYPPSTGGAQLHQHVLFQHMRPAVRVRVASFWDDNRTDWLLGTTLFAHPAPLEYEIDGIPVHRIGLSIAEKARLAPLVPLYYPAMRAVIPPIARLIEGHLHELEDDLDVVHNMRIGREPLSFASLYLARKRDIPFVLTPVHHPRWTGWRYRQYEWLYRQADMILPRTESEKRILMGIGVSEERIVVSGNGPIMADQAHPEEFRRKHGIEGPIILFLGQHYDYKGFVQMLRGAPSVWSRHPDAHFVFIGPSVANSEDAFRDQDPRVHRLGKVSLQEKSDALAACTLLCVPSTQEAFGGVYVEAWHYARPVIGCRIPAVSEVITEGVDGLLVEQTPDEIADAIDQMLTDPVRTDDMGRSGQRKVEEKYGWDALARNTVGAYRTALGRSAVRP